MMIICAGLWEMSILRLRSVKSDQSSSSTSKVQQINRPPIRIKVVSNNNVKGFTEMLDRINDHNFNIIVFRLI